MKRASHSSLSLALHGTLLLLFGAVAVDASAQLTGIGYNVTPTAERTFFQANAALGDANFYGGKLGFSFGEFAELRGVFLTSGSFSTDFSNFTGVDPATDALLQDLSSREMRLQRYGGELKFNLGRGSIFPTLSLGTGVMRFDPEGLQASETVYLEGAVGVQFSVRDRYTLSVEARDLAYRYNPASTLLSEFDLSDVGASPEDFEQRQVNNLGVAVGMQVYLGGRSRGELTEFDEALRSQFSGGLRGIRLEVEPFGSQITFKSELGFRQKQRIGGVNAGVDLGQYVGVRGFYWRGVEDGSITNFDRLQAYGAEMRLGFGGETSSIRPFLTLGGGYMDVMSNYQGNGTSVAKDRPFAMGGAGLVVPLGESLNLHGSARALLMSTEGVDNVGDPSSIFASGMYTVGLSFSVGGRGQRAGTIFEDRMGRSESESRAARRKLAGQIGDRETEIRNAEARLDSLARAVVLAQEGNQEAIEYLRKRQIEQDSLLAGSRSQSAFTGAAAGGPAAIGQAQTAQVDPKGTGASTQDARDRWVTLPVPQEGELYVRYGTPGGVTVETLNGDSPEILVDPLTGRSVTTARQPQASVTTGPSTTSTAAPAPATTLEPIAGRSAERPLTPEEIAQIVRSTMQTEMANQRAVTERANEMQRLEKMIEDRLASIERSLSSQRTLTTQPVTTVVQEVPAGVTTVDVRPATRFASIMPFTGAQIDNTPQVLAGIRADFRRGGSNARFMPEFVMGFGNDVAFGVHANGAFPFFEDRYFDLRPYVGAGLGMTNIEGLELVLNLLVGVERNFVVGDFFIEYMTSDLLDYNRVALGYRLGF